MEKTIGPVMTIAELRKSMQELGIGISHEALSAGIEQGIYPFASCYRVQGSTRNKYLISRKKFLEWVADFVGEEAYETV